MRVEVQFQEELRAAPIYQAEVRFELRALKDAGDFMCEVYKRLPLLLTQVDPRQLVVPALVLKLRIAWL
jgi:hypothetical protein